MKTQCVEFLDTMEMEIRPTKRTCIDSTTRWGDKLPFRIPTRTEQEFGELCTAAVLAGQTKAPTGPLRGPLEIGPLCHKVAGPGAARRTGKDFSGHFRVI